MNYNGQTGEWYALIIRPGHEIKVRDIISNVKNNLGLGEHIIDVIVPTEKILSYKDGKENIRERAIFSGYVYLFVSKFDNNLAVKLRTIPNIGAFVGSKNEPVRLTDKDVTSILKLLEEQRIRHQITLEKGDSVRVKSGNFENFTGIIEHIDYEHNQAEVHINIFGRNTPVEILVSQIEPIA